MTEKEDIDALFNSIGFGLPENSNQLEKFDALHKDYVFKADVNKIDPKQILESIQTSTAKVTNIDYHKRTVLAAEIVYRLKNEVSLGHLKLQKLLYLCQNAMKMTIHANFLQQALGPYDPTLMRSLDKQFKERKWFKFQKDDFPKYIPLEKSGEHKEWFNKYFKDNTAQIDFIIETFRKMKTSDVELVATIFACWYKLKKSNVKVSDELIINSVYEWSEEKAKFKKEEIINSIKWMRSKGIIPQ